MRSSEQSGYGECATLARGHPSMRDDLVHGITCLSPDLARLNLPSTLLGTALILSKGRALGGAGHAPPSADPFPPRGGAGPIGGDSRNNPGNCGRQASVASSWRCQPDLRTLCASRQLACPEHWSAASRSRAEVQNPWKVAVFLCSTWCGSTFAIGREHE